MAKLTYISLGCPKNQADTDHLIELISHKGFGYTDNVEDADAFVVNTCCFIDDAKRESIDVILRLSEYGRNNAKLIVMGCMGRKYKEDLQREIPEIDAIFGVDDFDNVLNYVASVLKPGRYTEELRTSSSASYAYVKIADGCGRRCSFCAIPSIRGSFRSVRPDTILRQVRNRLNNGIKEIILVAQDVTGYGRDLGVGYDLSRLIRDIASLQGDFRIRLLYLYPAGITEEIINTIKHEDKVCHYFDLPVQHCNDEILHSMRRGYLSKDVVNTINYIKRNIPGSVLRTTLIVGFPGETDKRFEELKQFVREIKFDRLGVFKYSPQDNTDALNFGRKVPERTKEKRFHEIMQIQSNISLDNNRVLIGGEFRALIDEIDGDTGIARLFGHAPEIDGAVLLSDCGNKSVGDFVQVKITDAYDYDLIGEIINE